MKFIQKISPKEFKANSRYNIFREFKSFANNGYYSICNVSKGCYIDRNYLYCFNIHKNNGNTKKKIRPFWIGYFYKIPIYLLEKNNITIVQKTRNFEVYKDNKRIFDKSLIYI